MNTYTHHHIERFYKKFISRTFDQDDVAMFIVLARDYTPKGSIFREFGDFLAHPDEKNRGLVIKSFQEVINFFDENTLETFAGAELPKKISLGIGALDEVMTSLCAIFALVGIEHEVESRNELRFRDFVFCLIFLLGNCRLKMNGQLVKIQVKYGNGLSLSISYESASYQRHYLSFNLMLLCGVWPQSMSTEKKLSGYIVRRFSNGCLGAIPYELDEPCFDKDMQSFERGVIWPLNDYRF
ncbi:hypothetical protein HWQ46_01910 [Shewanella sp. D64]|uniref:hypothetical protein n=1 Tax=unclassified Shewanella TaxID=196818 RepID=UPI0022BA5B79|nr:MULTISPECIES: hypothetical protein [unclassified Shewanella]MEC4724303.1 hypothetical protein [Shewanella sp. D64]MEC4738815.1 hypothetical protein [Shewanella sp. E94]WBJ97746.1 hypothetical protein HWQ47_11945 [Shewanella sp. MTB7]